MKDKVPMLFLTASCNDRICSSFEAMIDVKITDSEWPSAVEIANRRVSIFVSYSQKPIKTVINDVCCVLPRVATALEMINVSYF